jgi:hypothetical protein
MSVPNYSYADEMMSPRQIGIKRGGNFDDIMRAVAGVNYYADVIGFGESTVYAKSQNMQQTPLGIRYFLDTGSTCSNGAKMYEYVDTVPKGLGGRVGEEMKAMGLPELKGLGPGIVEDAASALNPVPLMNTLVRGGYAKCKQVTLPVGDAQGRLASQYKPNEPWIQGPTKMVGGKPHQTRWIFDDWISAEDYDATPKTAEGFTVSLKTSQVAAVVLLGTLVAAMYITRR